MGFNPQTDIPRSSNGLAGMNQGPQGMAQGPQGAAIGQAYGSQFGLQRDQLGGMNPPAQGGNPMTDAITSLTSAAQGTGAPTPGPIIPIRPDFQAIFARLNQNPGNVGGTMPIGRGGVGYNQ